MGGNDFKILDSGERKQFGSGAVRDIAAGKGRYDLLPTRALRRLALHYEGGAVKYGDNNWLKGIPTKRMAESAARHLFKALEGQHEEDHWIAAAWNILGIVEYQERIKEGLLPPELDTLSPITVTNNMLAYAAGIIDGEGCIKICRVAAARLHRNFDRYQLQVQVDMVNRTVIDFLYNLFGGKIYFHKKRRVNCNNSWRWYIVSQLGGVFLEKILPYLTIKKEHAINAVEFLKLPRKSPLKEVHYQKSRHLNKRGVHND